MDASGRTPVSREFPALLPCPFCGSDDVDPRFALVQILDKEKYEPGCMKCGATAPKDLWNKASRSGDAAAKDQAYLERNHLAAALARMYPSGVSKTNIPGWSPDWHGCCFIDLPSGQISYHFHDSLASLFAGLPPYTKSWDGHDKEEVHARLAMLGLAPVSETSTRDTERLNWLEGMSVEVRTPLLYGSRECFITAPEMVEGADDEPSNIREQIDYQQRGGKKP